jgi:hypothetical protein
MIISYTKYETIIDAASGGLCTGEVKHYVGAEVRQHSGKRSVEISKR